MTTPAPSPPSRPATSCPVFSPATPPAAPSSSARIAGERRSAGGRRRDLWVYLAGHPVLFGLLAATRGRPVRRLGRHTLLVHERDAFLTALTRVPLDRTADGTTGGAAGRLAGPGLLFDQQGDDHRQGRRDTAGRLGAAGVERLRPVWRALLDERLAPLAGGGPVDLVPLAAEIAGATAAALLGLDADPLELADAARAAGAAAARDHLPGPGRVLGPLRRRNARRAEEATDNLLKLVAGAAPGETDGMAAMLVVAAVTTTVAGLPRAAAWACGDDLWAYAGTPALTDELLRVTAPTPLLPRVAAADAEVAGRAVRRGDRMLLIARHAADAHRRDPDPADPAPAQTAQLVFGAGPHACPGARLARAQLGDLLAALAPYRPVVVRARADRRSALPSWRSLVVRASVRPSRPTPSAPARPTPTPHRPS